MKGVANALGHALTTTATIAAPVAGAYMMGRALSNSPYGYGYPSPYGGMGMGMPYGGMGGMPYGGMPYAGMPYGGYNNGMSSFLHF